MFTVDAILKKRGKMKFIPKGIYKLLIIIVLTVFVTGCTSWFNAQTSEDSAPVQPTTSETTAVYYDFEDVLIPKELKIVDDQTVVVSTPGFTSGIITLKGRVEKNSLFNFFSNNMQKDNWSIVSQIKSPGTTIMVFQKTSRCAVITIRDEQINTYVEIGVAPTVSTSTPIMESSDMGMSESILTD